ncbi:inactive selenide, water dikinase-like protein [Venturia canescens]|uniref:inactive selenide, water dikinase-like protein n=1 Tax=Venturia canescens TaxID=32260 RepID=UPI001C9C3B52|nr:inactive selenide, water dikinase-like protein [Venturia canescens]
MSAITRIRDSKENLPSDSEIEKKLECASNELYNDVPCDPTRAPFVPADYGLPANFRLTKYGDTKSLGIRPTLELLEICMGALHESYQETNNENWRETNEENFPLLMDEKTLLTRLHKFDLVMLETSNTLTPLIDDPYIMGKIACLSVLSGIYALGIVDITTTRIALSIPSRMDPSHRKIVLPMIIRGFKDAARESKTTVYCSDVLVNPWCLIGGTATAVCTLYEFIPPDGAALGDVIVLTKPLGTSIALAVSQWLEHTEKRKRLLLAIDEDAVIKAKQRAIDSMLKSNREAAILMRKYNAHAACEVTHQGLLKSAATLAQLQKNPVNFVIHNLPVIAKMNAVSRLTGDSTKLLNGSTPELSGGLILVLPREQAAAYCKIYDRIERRQTWIIGLVEEGQRTARIIDRPRVIEVPAKENDSSLW